MKSFATLLSALILSLGVSAPDRATAQNVVDQTFAQGGLSWGGPRDGFIVRWRPYIIDGQLVICGAYGDRGRTYPRTNREVLRRSTIKYQGNIIRRDLRFFNYVQDRSIASAGLLGGTTTCQALSFSAANVDLNQVELDIATGRFRILD